MNNPSTTTSRSRAASICAVLAFLCAGMSLRLQRIDDRSLWEDELSTWTSIRGSILDGVRYVQMPHPPLYSLSCRLASLGAERPSEFQLRLPAAIYGGLAALAGGWLGAMLFGRKVGWATLAVLTCNAFLIRYSREARMYSLLVLTTTLSVGLWWLLCTQSRNRTRVALGYVLATTAMLYSHYFAGLVLVAQAAWYLSVRGRIRRLHGHAFAARFPIAGMGMSVLLFAPLAVFFIFRIMPNKLGWIRAVPMGSYVKTLGEFLTGIPESVTSELRVWAGLIQLAFGFTVVLVLLLAIKPGRSTPMPSAANRLAEADLMPGALLSLWVACVMGGLWIVSAASSPVFVPRYAISAIVPVTVVALATAARWKPPALIGVAIVVAASNLAVVRFERLAEPQRPNGLEFIIRHLNQAARSSDAVVVVDFPFCPNYRNPVEMGFDYYELREDIEVLRLQGDQKTGAVRADGALQDPRNLHIITILGDVESLLNRGGRPYDSYLASPYRYFVVHGTGDTPEPAPIVGT